MNQTVKVQLDQIITDAGTQARVGLNEDVVAEYAEAIIAGVDMPPITVFHDGKRYILADGFHRYFAHVKARAMEIAANVCQGTKRDAMWHALGANQAHGLRRTNADKREAVRILLRDKEWAKLSDREIAEHLGVSHPFVAAVRNPEVAERQASTRTTGAKKPVSYASNTVETVSTADCKPLPVKEFPNWSGEPKTAKPAEKPEPADDEGPTLAELVDELQRENESLRAVIKASEADDLKAEAIKWRGAYEHAKREQGVAMDNAAKSQDREKFIVRMLRRCAKAVGVADPNHTDPRDIVKAVEAFAAGRSRHAA